MFAFCHKGGVICISEIIDIDITAILIPTCASSSPAFLMMHSAGKLSKQGDNIQPWYTPFPIWNQSVVPCPVLTVAWNVRSMNQGKLEVVKQEMARVNIDILGISEPGFNDRTGGHLREVTESQLPKHPDPTQTTNCRDAASALMNLTARLWRNRPKTRHLQLLGPLTIPGQPGKASSKRQHPDLMSCRDWAQLASPRETGCQIQQDLVALEEVELHLDLDYNKMVLRKDDKIRFAPRKTCCLERAALREGTNLSYLWVEDPGFSWSFQNFFCLWLNFFN